MLTNHIFFFCSVFLFLPYKESNFEMTIPHPLFFVSVFFSLSLSRKPISSVWLIGTLMLFYGMRCYMHLES
jgi:hypothetical protein